MDAVIPKQRVDVVFQIGLHKKDLEVLKVIQAYFGGVGVIVSCPKSMVCFQSNFPKTNLR